ncbi:MAG: hypothetical protein HOK25_07415 [Rhodospirillaceae bacterium]|nr:hypothetical protein [Rhodospirillaceae bacterium]
MLHNNGFRDINFGKTLASIKDVLAKGSPDLLIASCELKDGDFIDYIKEIRRGNAGHNPFIPIITLIETPTPELVARVVESGTDTVIAKPISTAQLLDRIDDLIESRKKFVVSEAYVGPARRKDNAEGGIEAPNTLRAKAIGEKLSFAEVEAMISQAMAQIQIASLDVIGAQIAAHVTNLVPMLERAGRLDPSIRQELLSLLDITDGSSDKLSGSKFEHVTELCESVGNVASAILAARGGAPDPRDIQLLKPLSQAIQACFSGAITSAVQVSAIVQQIGAR